MKKPDGNHHTPFTRAMWDRWLARLNAEPEPRLEKGIQSMRKLLQARCLGEQLESDESMLRRLFKVRGGH